MKKGKSLSLKDLPKETLLKAYVTDKPSPNTLSEVVEHIKKTNSVRDLMRNSKQKLPSLKEPWNNTRDVSHLKDPRDLLQSQRISLPTEISSLSRLFAWNPSSAVISLPSLSEEKELSTGESLERFLLGNPSGRQNIENLGRWFRTMKEKTVDNLEGTFVVLNTCLGEIVRQVSVHCLPRGLLLKEVLDDIDLLYKDKCKNAIANLEKSNAELKLRVELLLKEKEVTRELHEQEKIELYEKVNQIISEYNDMKMKNNDLIWDVEIIREKYLDLRELFDKKTSVIELLLKSLKTHRVAINPKIIDFLQKCQYKPDASASEASEGDDEELVPRNRRPVLDPKLFQEMSDNVIVTETAEQAIQAKRKELRKRKRYIVSQVNLKLNKSFENIKKKAVHEHYRTGRDNDPLYKNKFRHDEEAMKIPDMTVFELYDHLETELRRYFPQGVDFESWKAGVITGLEKGRAIGIEEGEIAAKEESRVLEDPDESPLRWAPTDYREENSEIAGGFERTVKARNNQIVRSTTFVERPPIQDARIKRLNRQATKLVVSTLQKEKKTTKVRAFQFTRKKDQKLQKRPGVGNFILHNLMEKPIESIRKKGNMTKKLVNKTISTIYSSALSKNKDQIISLIDVIHEDFMKRYALKSVANKKLIELVCSCHNYRSAKINTFIRFLQVSNKSEHYSNHSLALFLKVHHYMLHSSIGISIHIDESVDTVLLPSIRASESLKEKAELHMERSDLAKVQTWIDKNSVVDAKKINPGGLVNLDKFLKRLVEEFEEYQNRIIQTIELMIRALRFDAEFISQVELEFLVRFIDPSKLWTVQPDDMEDSFDSIDKEMYSAKDVFDIVMKYKIIGNAECHRVASFTHKDFLFMKKKRPEINRILELHNTHFEVEWRTLEALELEEIFDKFETEELDGNVAWLGWNIYFNEVSRINNDFLLNLSFH